MSVQLWPSMSAWHTYSLSSLAAGVVVEGGVYVGQIQLTCSYSELAWMLARQRIYTLSWISWVIAIYKAEAKNTTETTKKKTKTKTTLG